MKSEKEIREIYEDMLKARMSLINNLKQEIVEKVDHKKLRQDVALINGYTVSVNHMSQIFDEFELTPLIILEDLQNKEKMKSILDDTYEKLKSCAKVPEEIEERLNEIKELIEIN